MRCAMLQEFCQIYYKASIIIIIIWESFNVMTSTLDNNFLLSDQVVNQFLV